MILITDNGDCAPVYDRIRRASHLFLDTEFVREKTYFPQLCLLQMATDLDDDVFVIDTLEVETTPLLDAILDSPAIKIFHAGRQDLEIFTLLTGRLPAPLHDTQIMAAFLGYGEQVGMERMAAAALNLTLDKTQQYTDWARRPLSPRQLEYAALDVSVLKDLWAVLHRDMTAQNRLAWADEETNRVLLNPDTYRADPDEAWQRLKIRNMDGRMQARAQAMAAWRESAAIRRNVPRSWVLADDALIKLVERPKQKDRFLADADKETQNAISAILDSPPPPAVMDTSASKTRKGPLTAEQELRLETLKLLIKLAAKAGQVAPALIARADDLTAYILNPRDETLPFHTGWRRDLFGRHLEQFEKGQAVIRMTDAGIALQSV